MASTACALCASHAASAVAMPCDHVFCKEHIDAWFKHSGKTTCPRCGTAGAFKARQVPAATAPEWREYTAGDVKLNDAATQSQFAVFTEATARGEAVAVKVFGNLEKGSEDDRIQFRRDLRGLKTLNHPNVCRFLGTAKLKDPHGDSLIMERLADSLDKRVLGTDFQGREGTCGALGEVRFLSIFTAVAGALVHCKRNGLTHGDMKPHNVMFRGDGTPVLIDFGLSKHMESYRSSTLAHSSSRSTGTRNKTFLSPEENDEEVEEIPIDRNFADRVDVWGIGVCMLTALTGQPPYKQLKELGVSRRLSDKKKPEVPAAIRPEGLRALVDDCLEMTPAKRPTMEAVLLRLTALAGTQAPKTTFSMLSPSDAEYAELHRLVVGGRLAEHGIRINVLGIQKVDNPVQNAALEASTKRLGSRSSRRRLLHGTANAEEVAKTRFRLPETKNDSGEYVRAGTALRLQHGAAIYLTSAASKAAQFVFASSEGRSPLGTIIVVDTELGNTREMKDPDPKLDNRTISLTAKHNSVFCPRDDGDSYMVYDPAQTAVRYLVFFRTTRLASVESVLRSVRTNGCERAPAQVQRPANAEEFSAAKAHLLQRRDQYFVALPAAECYEHLSTISVFCRNWPSHSAVRNDRGLWQTMCALIESTTNEVVQFYVLSAIMAYIGEGVEHVDDSAIERTYELLSSSKNESVQQMAAMVLCNLQKHRDPPQKDTFVSTVLEKALAGREKITSLYLACAIANAVKRGFGEEDDIVKTRQLVIRYFTEFGHKHEPWANWMLVLLGNTYKLADDSQIRNPVALKDALHSATCSNFLPGNSPAHLLFLTDALPWRDDTIAKIWESDPNHFYISQMAAHSEAGRLGPRSVAMLVKSVEHIAVERFATSKDSGKRHAAFYAAFALELQVPRHQWPRCVDDKYLEVMRNAREGADDLPNATPQHVTVADSGN